MANEQNLRVPSSEEARKNGRKGGIASGEARRRKKALRDTIAEFMSMPLQDDAMEEIEKAGGFVSLNGKNVTVQEALVMKTIQTALKGNTKSMKMLFDLMETHSGGADPASEPDPLSKAFEELNNV